jgi:signal transduction histidine kinase
MLNELETEDNRPQTDKIGNLLIDMSELTKHSVKLADAGISIGTTEVVDLGEIIRETAELHVPSEIEFVGNYSLMAKADETKITQVLVNILENAVVHGRPTKIEVTSAVVIDGVNLTIANDGIQIPPEIRLKIFDYGFSSEEVRRGLGLAYVKKLIEAHGWTITLRDTRETAFVIWIPSKDLQI